MPAVDIPAANPYPLVSTITQLARERVNDTMNGMAGDLLADDLPQTQVKLNAAWQWLQAKHAASGGEPFKREVTILGFPARVSDDVMNQAYLGQLQSSDGVNSYQENFLLPTDMVNPMDVWRRNSAYFGSAFQRMELAKDGLPRYLNPNVYDWRDRNGLFFYPDSYSQDFLIRYQAQWPDLDLSKPNSRASIARCENCLAWRIAFEFASQRGAAQADYAQQKADEEFATIVTRTSKREQRRNTRPRGYGHRAGGLPYFF